MDYGGGVILASLVYLPLAIRRVYGSRGFGLIGKTALLVVSYGIALALAWAAYFFVNLAIL